MNANIDSPINRHDEAKDHFERHRLTAEEREEVGTAAYYRPYRIDRDAALKSRHIFWTCKRGFDIVCSLSALIVLSPVMLITMLLIYIEDPHSSPIFRQMRVGRGGKIFEFYNLRCMQVVHRLHNIMAYHSIISCLKSTMLSRLSDFRHSSGGVSCVLAA